MTYKDRKILLFAQGWTIQALAKEYTKRKKKSCFREEMSQCIRIVLCSARNARQSKQVVKPGQGKSSRSVKTADRGGFGSRLRQALGGGTNAEIARRVPPAAPAV